MKKKILPCIVCLCLIVLGSFFLTACGEQYINERTYNLINMQVIKDNTPTGSGYVNYKDGTFTDKFTGDMDISKSIVAIDKEKAILEFNDSEETGFLAKYTFDVYTGNDFYPTYKLSSVKTYYNGVDIENYSQADISNLSDTQKHMFNNITQFNMVMQYGNTSIQLATQNNSFVCHIIMLEKETNDLLFMAILYGF